MSIIKKLPFDIQKKIYTDFYYPIVLRELLIKHPYDKKTKTYEVFTRNERGVTEQLRRYKVGYSVFACYVENLNEKNRKMDKSWYI